MSPSVPSMAPLSDSSIGAPSGSSSSSVPFGGFGGGAFGSGKKSSTHDRSLFAPTAGGASDMNVDSLFANLSPTGLGSGISSGLGGPSSVDSSSLLNAAALGGRGSGGGAGGSGLGGGGLDGLDLGRGNSSLGGLGGLGGSLGLGSSTLGGGSSLGGSSLSGLGGTGLGASGVTGLGSGSLSRDDRSTSFSRSRLGNYMQSEPGADEGSAGREQSAPKASGKSAVPDYHKQAVEEDFFAGGGFFGGRSGGGLSGLGSDDGDDFLIDEDEGSMDGVVEDSYE